MALRKLHPVRLMDGFTSGGVQIILFHSEDGNHLLRILPDLLTEIDVWRKDLVPTGEIALELSSVHAPQAEKGVRTGLVFRIRMPKETAPPTIGRVCDDLGAKAVGWLTAKGLACDTILTDGLEGIVNLYPEEGAGHIRCFTKERRLFLAGSKHIFYFSPLSPLAALKADGIVQAISEGSGRGISLHLLPALLDQPERERLENDALKQAGPDSDFHQTILQMRDAARAYSAMLTVWGDTEQDAEALSCRIQGILRDCGLFLACRTPRSIGKFQIEQLVYDPWAYCRWSQDQVGVRFAYMAFLLTQNEILESFQGPDAARKEKEQAGTAGSSSELSAEQYTRKLDDAVLDRLMEKLKTELPVKELLAAASDVLDRLDALSGKSDEIGSQVEKMDAIFHTQETVYLRRMDVLEKAMKETADQAAKQIFLQFQNSLEQVMNRIAELPSSEENAQAVAGQLEKLLPQSIRAELTKEEYEALGVASDEELAAKGMLPEEIKLLRLALTLARLGLKQEGEDAVYMPFAIPMGCLYEMMLRNSFDRELIDHELENNRRENIRRQKRGDKLKGRPLPESKEKIELSFYDFISTFRVYDGYYQHVTLEGEKMTAPMAWNVWFACFKCVRAVRNKVHAACGSVSREELENLYHLMLCPGAAYKWASIRYLLEHPATKTDGVQDASLLIRHYGEGSPYELGDYIMRTGGSDMRESLIQFLLRLRTAAEWKE